MSRPPSLPVLNVNAAGIDIGATEHFVAVPSDRDERPVRSFSAFTEGLERLADWLSSCAVTSVVMESTGNFWLPLFELLEHRGFEVWLVDPRRLKQVPGRKTDVSDCQWLQQLHTFGLLSPAFQPAEQIVLLRSRTRQRAVLVKDGARQIQHMQDALTKMNLKLQHVVDDVSGVTGLAIIRAILAGERNPLRLASLRDGRCHNDVATIASALHGNYRDDHLFQLRQSLALYDCYQALIRECDDEINACLATFESKPDPLPLPPARPKRKRDRKSRPGDLRLELHRITGVDLTTIDGIDEATALTLISETGIDMTRWPNEKAFASWLRLCPRRDISGGKVIRRHTNSSASRAAAAFRMGASSLHQSKSALGAFYRRKRAQLGAPKAITATAHKMARIYYAALRSRSNYADPGQDEYERRYRERAVAALTKRAHTLGFTLQPAAP